MSRLIVQAGLVLMTLIAATSVAEAKPKNARQMTEGYWIGGAPTVADVDWLSANGIKRVISLELITPEARDAIVGAGIERSVVRFGMNFPGVDDLEAAFANVGAAQVYIHCEHGADRTGAVAVYLLMTRHKWTAERALLAVLNPSESELTRLLALFDDIELTRPDRSEVDVWTGVYSGKRNGGAGGLKIRNDDYRTLVKTTLAAAQQTARRRAAAKFGRTAGNRLSFHTGSFAYRVADSAHRGLEPASITASATSP